jgi:uncharacterized protein (DUF1697 family)
MTRFVAFLRGINVGGRVVKKEKLQEAFEVAGFKDVVTFRASGNVMFEAGKTGPEQARIMVEAGLGKILGYDVPVLVRTFDELGRVVASGPKVRIVAGMSLLVTLLPRPPAKFPLELPVRVPKTTAADIVSAKGSEVFSVTHGGGESALVNPFLESKLGVKATTRNINTLKEIVERYG